jgi:hypothetical protein
MLGRCKEVREKEALRRSILEPGHEKDVLQQAEFGRPVLLTGIPQNILLLSSGLVSAISVIAVTYWPTCCEPRRN